MSRKIILFSNNHIYARYRSIFVGEHFWFVNASNLYRRTFLVRQCLQSLPENILGSSFNVPIVDFKLNRSHVRTQMKKNSLIWLHIPTQKEQTQNVHANGKVLSGWQENKMWQGFPICMACLKKCVLFVMCAVVLKTKQTICCWIVMLIDSTCTDSTSSIHFMFTLKRHIHLCECRLLFIIHLMTDGKKIDQNLSQTDTNGKSREIM